MATHLMPPLPLFTKPELQAGFGLILPPDAAAVAADEWWALFAEEVDERGYFLCSKYPQTHLPSVFAVAGPQVTPAAREAQERAFWGGMSIGERRELLLRFSSFHFRLLGLVSDDLFERMRTAEGLSPQAAERGRAQMKGIVAAIQAGQR